MPLLPPYSPYASIFAWAHQIPLVLLRKVRFILGGGGGIGPGYVRIFGRKKSWPFPFLEWINASPFRNTQTKTFDPPPTYPRQK